MPEKKDLLLEMISKLKQQRDELALQMHLGKAETKEQWDKLEEKWNQLSSEYDPVKDVVGDTAEGVLAGLQLIAGEIKNGFERIRKSLAEEENQDK